MVLIDKLCSFLRSARATSPQSKRESACQIEVVFSLSTSPTCEALSWHETIVLWLQPRRYRSLPPSPASSFLPAFEFERQLGAPVASPGSLSLACFLLRSARIAFPDSAAGR